VTSQEQPLLVIVQDAVAAVFRRRKLILGAYVGILVTVALGLFVIPPTYRAAGKILLTADRAQISTSGDRSTELVRTNDVDDGEMISQLQILRSRELVDGVMNEMAPPREPAAPDPAGMSWMQRALSAPSTMLRTAYRHLHGLDNVQGDDPLYWRTRGVLDHLETNNQRPSNIIEVGFTSPDPAWAQDFVNRLMRAYVDHHAHMQQITEAQDFFNQQSALLREKLEASEAELQKVRERAGALAGQQAQVHERLNEFNADLARARIARVEQEQRVRYLDHTLNSKGGRMATPDLLELEAKRAELLGKYKPESERIRALDAQIARLRSAISSYESVTTGNGAAESSTDLVSARAALEALKGREEALGNAAAEYRRQAEFLDSEGFDLDRLQRQVKLDEETYTSYVRSAEQSRLSKALEQSKLLRLRILEQATLPLESVAPRKGQVFVFALLGGLLLSLGLGLARDRFDVTVKSSADIRRYANLDTLLVLPERS
jgi:uncharacterized protein involved in exopolysaccharide biosynthesis